MKQRDNLEIMAIVIQWRGKWFGGDARTMEVESN